MGILLASVGIESFEDRILRSFNKGLTVQTSLRSVYLVRQLNGEFPIQKTMDQHTLGADILPQHSTPLILHHASR